MLKHSFIYLILSILLVIFGKYAQWLIIYFNKFYTYINIKLTPLFNAGDLGPDLRRTFLLAIIPLIITAVPALSYQLIKGKMMPYLIESTWCVWFVLIVSNILIPR